MSEAAVSRGMVTRGEVCLELLAQGRGPRIVLLPSLGRGAGDFDAIAVRLAAAGYRVLRPQPRGIGASRSPHPYTDLHDCAADIATVIEVDGGGAALVAGHAFGNRVARMLATDRPELVRGVCLIAANVGHAPSTPPIRAAIRNSADPSLPDEQRLAALRFAFFAPGNDPRPWLDGWHPEVLAAQRIAGDRTARSEDYAGGRAPILYLQPGHDPLAHVEDALEFKRALGDRVTVIVIDHASHAAIAEQPEAISAALIDFAATLWPPPPIARPELRLDLSDRDLANLALQRSQPLIDLGGRKALAQWFETGDKRAIIAFLRQEDRAAAFIKAVLSGHASEVAELRRLVDLSGVRRMASIGPGLCLTELMVYRAQPCSLYLIDIEASLEHVHGFGPNGSGYANNAASRALLERNGVPAAALRFCNPRREVLDPAPVDLVLSTLSMGFHYPLDEYVAYLDAALAPGSLLIFDKRKYVEDRGWDWLAPSFARVASIDMGKFWRLICRRKPASTKA